jgi:hypothetical protein
MTTNGKNGNHKKREQTAKKIIAAIKDRDVRGLLTKAANKAGVSYRTVNRYVHDFPSVAEAWQEAKEAMLDFAESKLYEKINHGDTACIIFYLKTQGKNRGYVERQEFAGKDGKPVEIKVVYDNPDEK